MTAFLPSKLFRPLTLSLISFFIKSDWFHCLKQNLEQCLPLLDNYVSHTFNNYISVFELFNVIYVTHCRTKNICIFLRC